jgi:hypothetical protein
MPPRGCQPYTEFGSPTSLRFSARWSPKSRFIRHLSAAKSDSGVARSISGEKSSARDLATTSSERQLVVAAST